MIIDYRSFIDALKLVNDYKEERVCDIEILDVTVSIHRDLADQKERGLAEERDLKKDFLYLSGEVRRFCSLRSSRHQSI